MLKDRVKAFVQELDMPITGFCRKVEISTATYYKWVQGKLNLSKSTEQRIDEYLTRYGF